MLENALRCSVSRQTKSGAALLKFQVFVWMNINSSRKNSNQLENVRSLLTNCLEMFVPGTNWRPDI